MTNFIKSGDTITLAAPYAVLSGDGCLVGSLFGVASFDAVLNASVALMTEGEFWLKKTSALAIGAGDVLYWDDSAKELNKTSTGIPVAVAVEAAGNPSATVHCRLSSGYNAPLDGSILKYAVVALTNAQIKALRAAPVTLVAAPGATKVLEFVSAVLVLTYGTNVLSESAANMAIRYTDGSGAIVSQAIEATGFIDQAANIITNALPKIDAIVVNTGSVNKALVLHNTGAGEYGGNAAADTVMSVKIAYRVHTA
jgi:predicted RecA/RadA family phage recombinase